MKQANRLALELAEAIVRHCADEALPVGSKLTERKLAGAFGVSRSPIRSALQVLEERDVLARAGSSYVLARDPSALSGINLGVPTPAVEELYVRMLRDRFAGSIAEHFSEADLMRFYGVTRGMLMKALMRLAEDGYVSRNAGRGWTFSEMLGSVEAHYASYEFRKAVEPAALSSPNYRIDHSRVQRLLDKHLALLDPGNPPVDGATWFALDAELHEMLVSFSGNEFLLRAIRNQNCLRSVVEIESYYANERVKESFEEHIEILKALLNNDREWAATLLTRHLELACQSTEVFFARDAANA